MMMILVGDGFFKTQLTKLQLSPRWSYDFSGFFFFFRNLVKQWVSEMKVCSLCLLPSCSKLCVLGSPRLWPHSGLRQLRWSHLPADLHRAGPVGSQEDQQCSHCKSTPCLRVGAALRPRPVSAVHSLENGRSGGTAVRWAMRGVLSRHSWETRSEPLRWSQTEAACREARLHLPHSAQSSAGTGSFRSGRARALQGGTRSLPACRPCCAHCKSSGPAVTTGTPGPEWCYRKHRRKLALCFLCKVETAKRALWTVVGGTQFLSL